MDDGENKSTDGEKPAKKRKWGSKSATSIQNKPKKAASVPISTDSLKVNTFTLSQLLVYRTNQRRQQECRFLPTHSRLTLFAI